jgi:hypothetical protein
VLNRAGTFACGFVLCLPEFEETAGNRVEVVVFCPTAVDYLLFQRVMRLTKEVFYP